MKPRVWFGTMYSGENEFADCCHMISRQEGLGDVKQFVVKDMKEAPAHNALWSAWNEAKPNFDLFVKVDADTVLKDEHVVEGVWRLFETNPRVTGVQVKLHDFFTDAPISGLNFFSPRVVFNTSSNLWCDRVDTNHDVVLKGPTVAHLEPAGFHCKNPGIEQSFHFGAHRALKGQMDVIGRVYRAFVAQPNVPQRAIALLGAIAASTVPQLREGFDYSDVTFNETMASMLELDHLEATDRINRFAKLAGWT